MKHIVREIRKHHQRRIGNALSAEGYNRKLVPYLGELPRVLLVRILARLQK